MSSGLSSLSTRYRGASICPTLWAFAHAAKAPPPPSLESTWRLSSLLHVLVKGNLSVRFFLYKTEPSVYSQPQILCVFLVFLTTISTILHDLCNTSCLSQEEWDQPAAACERIVHRYSFISYKLTHCNGSIDVWQEMKKRP